MVGLTFTGFVNKRKNDDSGGGGGGDEGGWCDGWRRVKVLPDVWAVLNVEDGCVFRTHARNLNISRVKKKKGILRHCIRSVTRKNGFLKEHAKKWACCFRQDAAAPQSEDRKLHFRDAVSPGSSHFIRCNNVKYAKQTDGTGRESNQPASQPAKVPCQTVSPNPSSHFVLREMFLIWNSIGYVQVGHCECGDIRRTCLLTWPREVGEGVVKTVISECDQC